MLKRMKWIGLTGGIASGKSTVSKMFGQAGVPVIDADLIARTVVAANSAGLKSVVEAFGVGVLLPEGSLDRKLLGQKVFGKPRELLKLESIIHPLVQAEVIHQRAAAEKAGAAMAVYDVPLLYEKNLVDQFDAVVLVWTDLATQKKRLALRDGLSNEEIENRLGSQIPLDQKKLRADFVIENNSDFETLEKNFLNVLARLQSPNA